MYLVQLAHAVVDAATRIWSAGNLDQFLNLWVGWAVFTVLVCMPVYLPVAAAKLILGIKSKLMTKILNGTMVVNAVLAMLPVLIVPGICCLLPGYIIWRLAVIAWRGNRPQPQRRQRRRRRPEPEPEDDDDEEEED